MKTELKNNTHLLNVDLYRLIANCFDFPTNEKLETIKKISLELHNAGYPDNEINTTLLTLHQAINKEEILQDYSLIFIKGGVPLNESHTLQKFNSVGDVSAFYKAFGFTAKSGEAPDSIMYELEFLALLLLKSYIAPNKESIEITEKAYRNFLEEHAGEFSLSLAKKIRDGNAGVYFFTVSHLLETFITQELIKK